MVQYVFKTAASEAGTALAGCRSLLTVRHVRADARLGPFFWWPRDVMTKILHKGFAALLFEQVAADILPVDVSAIHRIRYKP
jgi:hypothetical protein